MSTAFNIVRFRVKPGREADFLEAHRRIERPWQGMRRASLVKTGERSYCLVGEWDSMADLAAARPQMIGVLDTFRDTLESMGESGVTDPVSGECVLEVEPHHA